VHLNESPYSPLKEFTSIRSQKLKQVAFNSTYIIEETR